MAWSLQTITDKDYEVIVKATSTGAESKAVIVDASSLTGAGSGTVLDIQGIVWSTNTDAAMVYFDATTDDHALALNGGGKIGFADGMPTIAKNPKSTGVTGDISASCAGETTLILKLRKVEGYSNLV